MDDVEIAFDEFEMMVGADVADLTEYTDWLEQVIEVAQRRLDAANTDLMGG